MLESVSLLTNDNNTYSQYRKGHPTTDATSNSGTLGVSVSVDSCITNPGDGTCGTSGNFSGLSYSASSIGSVDGINGGRPHADITSVAGAKDDVYYGTGNGARGVAASTVFGGTDISSIDAFSTGSSTRTIW